VLAVVAAVPVLRQAADDVVSGAIFLATSPFAPDVSGFSVAPQGTKVLAADGSLLVELDGGQRVQPVKLADLPPHVRNAVLAAEDARFYRHPGVDALALARAAFNNLRGGSEQGGSTITQQLAKINYTHRQRTIFRKLKEVLYAAQLERHFSKDELLQRYVNQVYFGEGAYGISAAAQEFFGVAPGRLTPAQAALLAGKIHSPEGLDPRKDPAAVQERRDHVLHLMHDHGWLAAADLDAALAEPVKLAPPQPAAGARAPHFVELVKREATGLDVFGGSPQVRSTHLFTGGFTIETTLDPRAFDAAAAAVKAQLGAPGDPGAAVVGVAPGDGAIRNLFGGLDFGKSQFDVASQGHRQPGSSFKPFVYLASLRQKVDPRSTFDSASPKTVPCDGQDVTVHNYEGEGGGQITVDDALARSVNVVFTQLACKVGIPKVVDAARDAGISEPIKPVPAVALGGLSQGVTPLEMAAAYATFAAKGTYAEPYAIARIKDRDGAVLYTHQKRTHQAFSDNEAGVLTAAMEQVVQRGTGTGAAIGRPLAGKTGTTENYGNAWFVGFVPQVATAVWVGHLEGDVPMTNVHGRSVAGGTFPASIFAATMRAELAGQASLPLFTASPDSLDLHRAGGDAPPPPPTSPATQPAPVSPTTPTAPPYTIAPGPDYSSPAPAPANPVRTIPTFRPPPTFPRPTTTVRTPSPTTSTTRAP
jgi:penicillin-binding protein 1A